MLIRNFNNTFTEDVDNLEKYGIITHKRSIFVFVNKNEWDANLCMKARFALINESVYYGDKRGNITTIKINNSTINRTGIYFGNIAFELPNDFRNAYFTVDVGVNKEKQALHDTAEVFNRDTSAITTEVMQSAPEITDELICSFETCVIPPMFYNELHMIDEFGDFGNFLVDITDNVYSYDKIVDETTSFYIYDINYWDSMKEEMVQKLYSENENTNTQEAFNLSEELTSSFEHSITQNSIFIYDSDARGFNKSGVNVNGGYIPNGKYLPKNYSVSNLDKSLKLFEASCHNIENQYGHVRVMCCPNSIGNKTKILFKDYNAGHLPLNPISKDENGIPSASIDTGMSTKSNVNEALDVMTYNAYTDYNNPPF